MKKSLAKGLKEKKSARNSQPKNHSYHNANLQSLPQALLHDLRDITILDVSHNFLENFHAQTIIKNADKLKMLYINDNHINVIPASLSGLKLLVDFRHDWNLLFDKKHEDSLQQVRTLCRKPDKLVKVSSVLGVNFINYYEGIMGTKIGENNGLLVQKVKGSKCSLYAKQEMLKLISIEENPNEAIKIVNVKSKKLFDCNYACFNNLFSSEKVEEKPIQEEKMKANSGNIKIAQIKAIKSNRLNETEINSTQDSFILDNDQKVVSLHKIFSKFDSKIHENMRQADIAFKSGVNPGIYNKNGFTIFHLCVMNDQIEGLKYLFEVNNRNPGFMDLEARTTNEGKNLFHLSVFLKKLRIATFLVESGFPLEKRDNNGNRAINLVDENFEFLYMLRLKMKKAKKKPLVRHPYRLQEQTKFVINQKRNDKLLSMFDEATHLKLC